MVSEALAKVLSGHVGTDTQHYAAVAGIKRTELASIKKGNRSVSLETALRVAQAHGELEAFVEELSKAMLLRGSQFERG